MGTYASFADPAVETAMKTMIEAGKEVVKWMKTIEEIGRATLAAGFPNLRTGGGGGAPYDTVADILRGTQGVVMDIYRQPEKIHAVMEKVAPLAIKGAVAAANATGSPVIFIPLHKGDESFMSPKQFETFYWPTFRKVLMGMIEEGLVPSPFAEGRYGARLEVIKDLPKSSTVWIFEDIDMARAKKVLGDTACIAGNVPGSLMHAGNPQEVKQYCRKLIETCAPGGGYILTGAIGMNEGNPDVLHAFMEAAEEYGVY